MSAPISPPLKIVIFVRRFAPDVGGIEMTAQVLARGFVERHGADVTVVTRTTETADDANFPFRVVREPKRSELLEIVREADVVLHNNPLMRFAWATWVANTPTVVAIRQYVTLPGKKYSLPYRLVMHGKYMAIEDADEIVGNSQAMAQHIPAVSQVIPNSYRDNIFKIDNNIPRNRQSLAFLGRLSWDKGPDMPIRALAKLREEGFAPTLTLMGSGTPEDLKTLQDLADELHVSEYVKFTGSVDGHEANRYLNEAAIAIFPSLQPESFGTAALEEAAAGCVVVGSNAGGLIQAIGPCGPLFEPGNLDDLVQTLRRLFQDDEYFNSFHTMLESHVRKHQAHVMIDSYYAVLDRVAHGNGSNRDARTLRGRLRRILHHGPSGGI